MTRLVIAIAPYPTIGTATTNAPVPLNAAQCAEMERRVDNLPPSVLANIKNVMTSVMGKHGRSVNQVLRDAVARLLCSNDRTDVQYPLIKGDVFIISASLTGSNNYTCDQIMALDMSGITKEPL